MGTIVGAVVVAVLVVGPVLLAVALGRRPARPTSVPPPGGLALPGLGLGAGEYLRVEAAVDRGERVGDPRLRSAAAALARHRAEVAAASAAELARLRALGRGMLVVAGAAAVAAVVLGSTVLAVVAASNGLQGALHGIWASRAQSAQGERWRRAERLNGPDASSVR